MSPLVKFAPVFDELGGISHGFFGRAGGVSKGIYKGLNVGYGSSDDKNSITENRARAAAMLGTAPPQLLTCHQCHSTEVITVDQPWREAPKADAIVTKTPGIALGALAADCAPVLFYDPEAGVIGAAHAGWRGALAGVTDETVTAMLALGARRYRIRAAIGPCISGHSYEVGPDFVTEFITENLGYATFFSQSHKQGRKNNRSYFDLKAFLVQKLKRAGLRHVSALPDCTYAAPNDYFSYRHNTHNNIADYGRNLSAIILNE